MSPTVSHAAIHRGRASNEVDKERIDVFRMTGLRKLCVIICGYIPFDAAIMPAIP